MIFSPIENKNKFQEGTTPSFRDKIWSRGKKRIVVSRYPQIPTVSSGSAIYPGSDNPEICGSGIHRGYIADPEDTAIRDPLFSP